MIKNPLNYLETIFLIHIEGSNVVTNKIFQNLLKINTLSMKSLFLCLFIMNTAMAADCNKLIENIFENESFQNILDRTSVAVKKAIKEEPLPITSNIELRRKQVWTGAQTPSLFQTYLPPGVSFVKTPDPNTESPYMVMRMHPGNSAMLHVELPFKGELTSTKLYIGKGLEQGTTRAPSKYLVGPENKTIIWHMHGGGTPSAVGANASSKAVYYNKRGIPVLSVDQPGHGNSTSMIMEDGFDVDKWNFDLMRKLIHPDVNIEVHGHSWGAMTSIRMWQNLEEMAPDLKITGFQAESPGADASLGKGTPREKHLVEASINENMSDWADRASPDDIEFLTNMVMHRKMSPVAQEFTVLTDLFYRWGFQTPEQLEKRKPINVLVGTYDGLVYVGREKIYDDYAKQITSGTGGEYHKFTVGKTFKEDEVKQGHQIFDMLDDNGDLLAYKIGVDFAGKNTDLDVSVRNVDGQVDSIKTMVNKIFNNWSNNFAFREYLSTHVEYIDKLGPTHQGLIKQVLAVKSFVGDTIQIKKEHLAFSNTYKIKEEGRYGALYKVKGGVDKANRELSVPKLTEERIKELNDFLDVMSVAVKKAGETYVDTAKVEGIAKLEKLASSKLGVENAESLFEKLDFLSEAKRQVNNNTNKINKSTDGKLITALVEKNEAVFKKLSIPEESKTLEGLTHEIAKLQTPTGNLKPKEWTKSFTSMFNNYKQIQKLFRSNFSKAQLAVFDTIENVPAGITSKSDAVWELSLDQSDERVTNLNNYIDGYREFSTNLEKELEKILSDKLSSLKRPEGIETTEEAQVRLVALETTLKKRFVPLESHPAHQEVKSIVDQLELLDFQLSSMNSKDTLTSRLQAVEKGLMVLRGKKAKLILNKKARESKNSNGSLDLEQLLEQAQPSEILAKEIKLYDEKLDDLIAANTEYAELQSNFFLELLEAGKLNKENLQKRPVELSTAIKKYEKALAIADVEVVKLEATRVREARLGNLRSENDPEGIQLKETLEKLLGEFDPENDKVVAGIEGEILALAKEHALIETDLYKTSVKIRELEKDYSAVFTKYESAEQNFSEVIPYKLSDILNMKYEDLFEKLSVKERSVYRQVLFKTLNKWEGLWSKLKTEESFKDTDFYKEILK